VTAPLDDTPIPDRIWDGLLAWMRGTLVVTSTALAIATTLGWPRRAAAELTRAQLAFLVLQAILCSAFVVRSGHRLCRRFPGALLVAFTSGVPAALALLMSVEWFDAREPMATWWELFVNSVRLSALEAVPLGYFLWILRRRPLALGGTGETPEAG
jgi:hypothetical protein